MKTRNNPMECGTSVGAAGEGFPSVREHVPYSTAHGAARSPGGHRSVASSRFWSQWRSAASYPAVLDVALVVLVFTVFAVLVASTPARSQQVDPLLKEGVTTHNQGRLQDAVEIYTEVLRRNPKSAEARNFRGMAYDDLEQLDLALADLNEAIALSPKYADAYNNRGEVHRKKKEFAKAIESYKKALELDPKFGEAQFNLGLVYEAQKNHKPAVAAFGEYLKLVPTAEDAEQVRQKIKGLESAPAAAAAKPAQPGAKPAGQAPAQPAAKPQMAQADKPGAKPEPGAKPAQPGAQKPAQARPAPPKPPAPAADDPFAQAAVLFAMFGLVLLVVPLFFYVLHSVFIFLIGRKTNTPMPWLAFIPIAKSYIQVAISGKPIWWLAVLLVPSIISNVLGLFIGDPTILMIVGLVLGIASLVAWFVIALGMAAARGKSAVWGVLTALPGFRTIGLAYRAFSK